MKTKIKAEIKITDRLIQDIKERESEPDAVIDEYIKIGLLNKIAKQLKPFIKYYITSDDAGVKICKTSIKVKYD